VLIDAFIVRALLVPSLMALLGKWNWYLPRKLEWLPQVSHEPRIGLDTEFLRERTYRAELCLIQIATPSEAVGIDPLELDDLGALAGVLSSPSTLKVMHAARQDLEVLWPIAAPTRPVFDTQIAASLIGLPAQVGYADAVRRLLGKALAKSHTRTDWSRRPLSAAQIEYALDDVRYLLPLVPFLLTGVALVPEMNGPDGVHPNAAGARRIAENVWPYLEPLLR